MIFLFKPCSGCLWTRHRYLSYAYQISLDATNNGQSSAVLLTPDEGHHRVQLSPNGRYLIDTVSKVDAPPLVSLRDAINGALLL
eukprot:COSAG05_NODE_16131_length_353_cov_0.602362_1_plen_83_part_10